MFRERGLTVEGEGEFCPICDQGNCFLEAFGLFIFEEKTLPYSCAFKDVFSSTFSHKFSNIVKFEKETQQPSYQKKGHLHTSHAFGSFQVLSNATMTFANTLVILTNMNKKGVWRGQDGSQPWSSPTAL